MSTVGPGSAATSVDQARDVGRLLAARIAGQSGLVSRSQALSHGCSAAAIRWQVESGRWVRLHRGVYLTTPGRDDWEMRAVAALLAVGPPSCLAGESAGIAWGLQAESESDIQVVVPVNRRGQDVEGIELIRSRRYAKSVHPTAWPHRTTVEHTVFDLSVGHGLDRCIALMAKACQLGLTDERRLSEALATRRSQPHRRVIREALGIVGAGAESAAEVRYIRDVEQAHGLPTGLRQEPAPGARFRDSEYPDYGVIVEIDGRLGHLGWNKQQLAGRRDRKASTEGKLTVRTGWTDLAVTPCELAVDVAEVLRTRGWPGRPRPCGQTGCLVRELAA